MKDEKDLIEIDDIRTDDPTRKGVKLSLRHKKDAGSFYACSECFRETEYSDRYCWYCGVVLHNYPIGGSIDYAIQNRNDYRGEKETGYEDDKDES